MCFPIKDLMFVMYIISGIHQNINFYLEHLILDSLLQLLKAQVMNLSKYSCFPIKDHEVSNIFVPSWIHF